MIATTVNQAALDVGQMAQRLSEGYFTHLAAIQVAKDPRAIALSPPVEPGKLVPEGYVFRKEGIPHRFHFNHYLVKTSDPASVDELARVWLVGALLTIGDALKQNNYFDRAPELELLRHLRNGVGHGNVFRFDKPENLAKYPAHNLLAAIRGYNDDTEFKITPDLEGQRVLFDFMGPGDVLDLIMSVSLYLIRMGYGQPLRPEAERRGQL